MTIDMDPGSVREHYLLRESTFSDLKKRFIQISSPHVTQATLDSLKECYSQEIGSLRDRNRIKNLADLIRILEYRDVLRHNEIEPLKRIAAECIRDPVLTASLAQYEAQLKGVQALPDINYFKFSAERPSTSRPQSHAVNFYANQGVATFAPSAPPVEPVSEVQEKVFRRVSEALGKSWRDVARFLGVRESEIDEIEAKLRLGEKEKAYEALLIFKSRCDPCNWRMKMQKALEKARRKDLAELMNEILLSQETSLV